MGRWFSWESACHTNLKASVGILSTYEPTGSGQHTPIISALRVGEMGRLLPGNYWSTHLAASVNFKFSQIILIQKWRWRASGKDTGCPHLASTYIHTRAYLPTSSHVYTETYITYTHTNSYLAIIFQVFSIRSVVYSFIGHFGPIKTFCLILENLRFKIIFHEISMEMSTWSTAFRTQGSQKNKQTINYENVLSSSDDTNQSSSLIHTYKHSGLFLYPRSSESSQKCN